MIDVLWPTVTDIRTLAIMLGIATVSTIVAWVRRAYKRR